MLKVGIQGLAASYSDAALADCKPSAERVLYESFDQVFEALRKGDIDEAFLPFENSTAGFITENFRLLDQSGFFVYADHIHKVEHCVLAPEGTKWSEIEGVLSHPQALAQCSKLFAQEKFKAESWFDTAGAARDVAQMKGKAAIASERAASVYGLSVLKRGVNDEVENFTRFMLIGKDLKWGKRILVVCDVGELRSLLLSPVKLVTMLTHSEPAVKWGHRIYLELEVHPELSWVDWTHKFPNIKILGSLDSKR